MSNREDFGIKFKHDTGNDMSELLFEHRISMGTAFRVERDGDGLSWEFVHEPLWAAFEKDDVDEVTYYGLLDAAATLRRWSAELTQKAHELRTPELADTGKLEVDD